MPRVGVTLAFGDVADSVQVRYHQTDADGVDSESADEGLAFEVDGVVLWAHLHFGDRLARGVTFHHVDPVVVEMRMRPDGDRSTSTPLASEGVVAGQVVGDDPVQLWEIQRHVEDVRTRILTASVEEASFVVERRPSVGDSTRNVDEDRRERCDGDGRLAARGAHETACAGVTGGAGPVAFGGVSEASTLESSNLIARTLVVAVAFLRAKRSPVTSSAPFAGRICLVAGRVALADATHVVAHCERVDLLTLSIRATARRPKVSNFTLTERRDGVALASGNSRADT